jgi:hypothetical protein
MSLQVPWKNGHKICLLSTSPVKKAALEKWLTARGIENELVCVEPPDTRCPQPAGERSAIQCLSIRMSEAHKERDVIFIAIENFIELVNDSRWVDLVAIGISYNDAQNLHTNTVHFAIGQFANVVPEDYSPDGMTVSTPRGFKKTIGSRIHRDNKYVPENDWAHLVDPLNIPRTWQIFDALWMMQLQINGVE